jgi:hypothetical protein
MGYLVIVFTEQYPFKNLLGQNDPPLVEQRVKKNKQRRKLRLSCAKLIFRLPNFRLNFNNLGPKIFLVQTKLNSN